MNGRRPWKASPFRLRLAYPQVMSLKEMTSPLALTLKWTTAWNVKTEPSEPVPWMLRVSWNTKFLSLALTPNQAAK
jgi:hypothetical protein